MTAPPTTSPMTPDRNAELLRAAVASMGTWIEELERLQRKCPEAGHLLAVIRQAKVSLGALLKHDDGPG